MLIFMLFLFYLFITYLYYSRVSTKVYLNIIIIITYYLLLSQLLQQPLSLCEGSIFNRMIIEYSTNPETGEFILLDVSFEPSEPFENKKQFIIDSATKDMHERLKKLSPISPQALKESKPLIHDISQEPRKLSPYSEIETKLVSPEAYSMELLHKFLIEVKKAGPKAAIVDLSLGVLPLPGTANIYTLPGDDINSPGTRFLFTLIESYYHQDNRDKKYLAHFLTTYNMLSVRVSEGLSAEDAIRSVSNAPKQQYSDNYERMARTLKEYCATRALKK